MGQVPVEAESLKDPVSGLARWAFLPIGCRSQSGVGAPDAETGCVGDVRNRRFRFFRAVSTGPRRQGLTRVMQNTLRDSDTICMLRDGVLAAVLDDTSETGAVWAADRIRRSLLETPACEVVTVSAGLACYPSHAMDADDLMNEAERALHTARSLGPGRIEVATIDLA